MPVSDEDFHHDTPEGCTDNLATCASDPCYCLEIARDVAEERSRQEALEVLQESFRFQIGEEVAQPESRHYPYTVVQRWIDVDCEDGLSRWYGLRDAVPLLGSRTITVSESLLTKVPDNEEIPQEDK